MNKQISIHDLRIAVKIEIAKADLGRHGLKQKILPEVSRKLGRNIHPNSMYNALSGNREGQASREILAAMLEILSMPNEAHGECIPMSCDYTRYANSFQ